MPWNVPSLRQVVADTIGAFRTHLPGADAALRANNLHPAAATFAGGLHGLYGYAGWIADQAFVARCDDATLDLHGAEMKPPVPRKAPSAASGLVIIESEAGASLPAGTVLTRSDGLTYTLDAGVIVPAGVATDAAISAVDAGAAGNADAGALFTSSVAGLTIEAGPDGISGGADLEDAESYRHRLLFARAFPEHAGALPDFVRYTTAVAGVTRVFIATGLLGRNTVRIYPMFDRTMPNGIPSAGDLDRVRAAIALAQPGGVYVEVQAPAVQEVAVTIADLEPDTPEVRLAVEAEIRAEVIRRSRVAGTMMPHPSMPWLATPTTVRRSWLVSAAAAGAGEDSHTLTLPAADVPVTAGAIPVVSTVTFA